MIFITSFRIKSDHIKCITKTIYAGSNPSLNLLRYANYYLQ